MILLGRLHSMADIRRFKYPRRGNSKIDRRLIWFPRETIFHFPSEWFPRSSAFPSVAVEF